MATRRNSDIESGSGIKLRRRWSNPSTSTDYCAALANLSEFRQQLKPDQEHRPRRKIGRRNSILSFSHGVFNSKSVNVPKRRDVQNMAQACSTTMPASILRKIPRAETAARKSAQVTYGKVEVREYCVELGENPYCTSGPVLTIGWYYQTALQRSLIDYEALRSSRRSEAELFLPKRVREARLREHGFSRSEIEHAVQRKSTGVRVRENVSAFKAKYENKCEESLEGARRKVLRLFRIKDLDGLVVDNTLINAKCNSCRSPRCA